MAKKYLDENGLAYFWSKVKQYLATPTRAGLMSPTDKAKVDAITNQGTIAYYRKLEGSYTTISTGEDTIPIPITSYSTADILLVDINGLDLVEGVDYTVSGTNIVLATPISIVGQVVHFIALRATTATSADYSILKGDDGDVSDVLVDGNSVVNQQGIANISIQSLGLIDVFYPVGSYYETSDTSFDPNVTWGGTWSSETITDDAIVEEGTSGIWTYRKWESGIAECWGKYSKSIAANTVDINNYATYPFTFTESPNITIGLHAGGADLYRGHVEPSQSNTSRVRLVLINKHTSAVTLNMNMYVKGYWKAYVAPTTINRWHRTA